MPVPWGQVFPGLCLAVVFRTADWGGGGKERGVVLGVRAHDAATQKNKSDSLGVEGCPGDEGEPGFRAMTGSWQGGASRGKVERKTRAEPAGDRRRLRNL